MVGEDWLGRWQGVADVSRSKLVGWRALAVLSLLGVVTAAAMLAPLVAASAASLPGLCAKRAAAAASPADAGHPAAVIFTFDDGKATVFSQAARYMAQYGFVGTAYVNGITVGGEGRLTLAQCHALYDVGWDIANHTWSHQHLAESTEAQMAVQIGDNAAFLEAQGFARSANHLCFPFGEYNPTVQRVARQLGQLTMRTTVHGGCTPPYDWEALRVSGIPTTVDYAKGQIDAAIATGGVQIYFGHDLPEGSADLAYFRQLVDYVASRGVRVLTVSQWFAEETEQVTWDARLQIDDGAQFTNDCNVRLGLSALCSAGAVTRARFSEDGVGWPSWSTYAAVTPLTVTAGDGAKTVHAQVTAGDGWVAPEPLIASIVLDTVAPVTAASEADGLWRNTPAAVAFSASDESSGVAYTEFTDDPQGAWIKGPAVSVSTSGVTTLQYRSADRAGNVEAPHELTVRIDTGRPGTSAAAARTRRGALTTLRCRIDDPAPSCGVAATVIRIARPSGRVVRTIAVSSQQTNVDLVLRWRCNLVPGRYVWSVAATDIAGNRHAHRSGAALVVR